MTEKKAQMLRLPEDVISKLKQEAESQHRSVNNLIEVIIDQYFKNIDKR